MADSGVVSEVALGMEAALRRGRVIDYLQLAGLVVEAIPPLGISVAISFFKPELTVIPYTQEGKSQFTSRKRKYLTHEEVHRMLTLARLGG